MDDYKMAVQAVYNWQYESMGSFYEIMVLAYRKAYRGNKRRIAEVFPNIAKAVQDWDDAGDYGNDLFREHKIGKFADGQKCRS